MGKKSSWFSAIKRVFVSNSKEEEDKRKSKVGGKARHGDRKSFIPLFREPSSIEKILGEAERELNLSFRPQIPPQPEQQAVRQPEQQAFRQPVQQTVRQPQQTVRQPVQQTVRQPEQQTVRQPEQQTVRQPVQQTVRQPEQQTGRQPEQQTGRQPEQQTGRQPEQQTGRQPEQQTGRQPEQQTGRQPEQQTGRQPEQQLLRPPAPFVPSSLPLPLPLPPPAVVPPRPASPRPPSPRSASQRFLRNRPDPTLRNQHASATKIQAAYRGYMGRRSFRALRGLVRLQGVVKGNNVKRQTMNAMKYMQMLVRVQSQIQSRRIQMVATQAQDQANEVDSKFGVVSEGGRNGDWDDSVHTKEEADARLQRKVEAIMKREKAMAYAYSNQLWKSTPNSTPTATNLRPGGVPWWWNWLERQLPQQTVIGNQTAKSYRLTPARSNSGFNQSPRTISSINNYTSKQQHQRNFFENTEAGTTRSSRLAQTPLSGRTTPLFGISSASKYNSRSRASGGDRSPFGGPLRDDDSLVSCPPFSVPNYMVPTVSAQAKARPNSNPRERFPGTPGSESSRRSSFPMTQMGSYKWNKGSFFAGKDSSPQKAKGGLDKYQTRQSMDTKSVDSTVSLPVGGGRKPFNRFV